MIKVKFLYLYFFVLCVNIFSFVLDIITKNYNVAFVRFPLILFILIIISQAIIIERLKEKPKPKQSLEDFLRNLVETIETSNNNNHKVNITYVKEQ